MSASEDKAVERKETTKEVVVVFYSRSGTTKTAAEALCKMLENNAADGVEMVQIGVEQANEGYLYNGYMAITGKSLEIKSDNVMLGKNVKEVWLCGPVHAWSLCAALKKYIEMNVEVLKAEGVVINALATMGGSGETGFYKGIEDIVGKQLTQKLVFTTATVKDSIVFTAKLNAIFKPKAEESKPEEPKEVEKPKEEEQPKAEEPKAEEKN